MQSLRVFVVSSLISMFFPVLEARICGRNYTASSTSNIINSPNYPNNHGNNLNCQWIITSGKRKSVMLQITSLDTEKCCDYLEVYDGASKIGKFQGQSDSMVPIVSAGSSLRLVFRSDSTVSNTGFQATYKEVNNCGSPLRAGNSLAHFSTPFYPGAHPHNLDCYWSITAPNKRDKIDLTILEGRTDPCCDLIYVYDGTKMLGEIKGAITAPRKFRSTGRTMGVYFHSNDATARDGFRAAYKQYECGGNFQLTGTASQTITSPNYPNNTDHHLNCTFNVKAEDGYRIEITFKVDSEKCCDYIDVFEGLYKIGRLSGKLPKASLVTGGNNLRLLFHTDGSIGSKGFTATFHQVLPRCGVTTPATNKYQNIVSPGFPSGYPNNYRCDWTIVAPENMQIVLTFDTFVTESCCDFVQVFDGFISIGKFKGELNTPFSIVSTQTKFRLMFSTDDTTSKKGFEAKFKLTNNCGKKVVAVKKNKPISSPGYPRDYSDNADCMWTIVTGDYTQVVLNISELATEKGFDYVQVLDGINPVARLEGNLKTPRIFRSTQGMIRIYLHSDGSATRDGFFGTYHSACEQYYNVTTALKTYLSSPNYPKTSPKNLDCIYHLNTVPGKRIKVQVQVLNTEECCDYLEIYDGPAITNSTNSLAQLKGLVTSPNASIYASTGTSMVLHYHTARSGNSAGFQLTYYQA